MLEDTPDGGLTAEIEALEHAVWSAAQAGRMDDFRSYLADDYLGLYARGPIDAITDTEDTAGMQIRSFHLERVQVRVLGPHLVLCTHLTRLHASSADGKDISGDYWGASLWRTTEGRRTLVYHTAIGAA